MDDRKIILSHAAHPFRGPAVSMIAAEGQSIRTLLLSLGIHKGCRSIVQVDGEVIPETTYGDTRLVAGQHVAIKAVPTGGGGGGKDILQLVAFVAVVAAAAFVSYGVAGYAASAWGWSAGASAALGAAAGAGVALVGSLIVSALVPPPSTGNTPLSGDLAGDSVLQSITGAGNRANPYGVIPQVLGKTRMYPLYAAEPYTEVVGKDQYLRLLLTFGYGPLTISDIKIGETPIDEYDGVSYEVREGLDTDEDTAIYSNDVHQESLSVTLTQADGWVERRTRSNTDEISIDLTFIQGLVTFSASGSKGDRTVTLSIQYRAVGDAEWISRPDQVVTDHTTGAFRIGDRWSVTTGQYDVRVQRVTADTESTSILDTVAWTMLRSISTSDPVKPTGLAKLAVLIKATDQLNNVIDSLNAIVQTRCPDWDKGSGTWVTRETSNPASLYRYILQGPANAKPVADSRIDLESLQAWHEECEENDRMFNAVFDKSGTVFDRLGSIAAIGRAAFSMKDGKYSVVRDVEQTTPVQHFTPRNTWGFKAAKAFPIIPHALRVRYINPDTDWQEDDVTVYADGYSEATATEFEDLVLEGVTNYSQAWKMGRYHLAAGILRPEVYEFNVDFEHLVCQRGDLVRVTHDIPLFGSGYGRIKSLTTNESDQVTSIKLDTLVTMEAGIDYVIRIRSADFSTLLLDIETAEGETDTLTLTAPTEGPLVGDMVLFGEQGKESVEMIVKEIEPGQDLTAKLTLVDAAPAIHQADQGTIPDYDPQMTLPARREYDRPLPPVIEGIRSDRQAIVAYSGITQPAILLNLGALEQQAATYAAVTYEVHLKQSSELDSDWRAVVAPSASVQNILITGVEKGVSYDVRIRTVDASGHTSYWVYRRNHVVIGSDTTPPDVLDARLDDGWLTWSYQDAPDNLAGFLVRYLPTATTANRWTSATVAHEGVLGHNQFNVAQLVTQGTAYTFMVKAVTMDGVESNTASTVILGLGQPLSLDDEEIHTDDVQAEGFPGTLTNLSIVDDDLAADIASGDPPVWPLTDNSLFWGSDDDLAWSDEEIVYAAASYVYQFMPLIDSEKPAIKVRLDANISGKDVLVEIQEESPDVFWGEDDSVLAWSDDEAVVWTSATRPYTPWSGVLTSAKRAAYNVRISMASSTVRGMITAMRMRYYGTLLEERLNDVTIPIGGGRLPIGRKYNLITQVGDVALQDDGGAAVSIKIVDKNPTAGPLIKAFDSLGVETSAVIDATVKGY